jgi:hypothetical protein
MASTLNAAIGAAAAMLFWTCIGVAVTRRVVPALAWPMAPVVGWAVHSTIALPLFFVLPFSATNVLTAAGLTFLAAVAASLTTRADASVSPVPASVPAWAYALAALLAMAPAAAVLPKIAGDAVYLAAPIFDHAKVALIDDMMKLGLPPGNPFFGDPDHPRFSYYYLWHFSAAELALAIGISGWEADVAMTWFSAAASLAMMMGLAAWIGGREAAILVVIFSATASARVALWWIFGVQNVGAVVGRAAGFAGWLFQAPWVPQHIMSAASVVAAVVLMSELARRCSALLVVTLGLTVAAGFESSTFIGGVTFAAAAPAAALVLLGQVGARRRLRFIAALAVAAALSICLVVPLLRDQLATMAARAAGAPIALQFYPVLGEYFSERLRVALDLPAFWLILLPIELSAVYVIGMIALAQFSLAGKLDGDRKRAVLALAALAVASLAVSWLFASTIADSNDLGWRAVLPAAVVLTAFAAAGMARWIAARAGIAVVASAVAIVLGLPGGIDLIRSDIAGYVEPDGRLFAKAPELWAAVRRHSTADERVGNNPLFLQEMTLWPVNISWALLAGRRSCYAGREVVFVYTSLGPRRTEEVDAQFIRVFAGDGSPADVRDLAANYDCRVVAVTAADGAWSRDPFAGSPLYRLVEEKAERWRIYRAIAGE